MSDLGFQIRSYYEDVVERVDPMTPPSPSVSEPTYRPLLVLAATALFVLVGIGLAPFLARWVGIEPAVEKTTTTTTTIAPPSTTIAAEEISPATTVVVEDVPRAVFKNPLLVPFFELPACGAHDLLAEWAVARMSAFADLGAWTSVTVEDVALVIPVYRDDAIACLDAVQFPSGAMAWAGLNATGNLVARAVTRNADGGILDYVDYDALQASGGEYHQDTIGSGQNLTGWVIDGGIEASVRTGGRRRHFIMELPGYELPAPDPQYLQAAAPMLQKLTVNRIETRAGAIYLGMTIPEGFVQCVVSLAVAVVPGFDALEQPVRGSAATFCNLEGDTFRIVGWNTQDDHPEPPPEVMPPDMPPVLPAGQDVSLGGGLTYRAWGDSDRGVTRWYAAVEVPYIALWMLIEAAPNMTLDDVTALLASSPWLDPTLVSPADGNNELRDVYSVEWITNILEAIGATNIVEEPQRRSPSSTQDSGPPPIDVTFDHESMEPWHGTIYAWVYEGDSPSPVFATVGSGLDHDSVEVDGVTLSYGIGPDGWAMLATANCGGISITMNIQGDRSNTQSPLPQFDHDPVRELAARFIRIANC